MDNDAHATVSEWAGIRKAVSAALLITYFVYYAIYYFASFKQHERPKLFVQIEALGAKLYLFGVGCLLSLNYKQASIHQVVFAYFAMMAIILIIFTMVFEMVSEKIRHASHIALYGVYSIWYMGIIIDYYNVLAI